MQGLRLAQPRHLEEIRGPASVCQLPPAILPWQVLRSCVVAGYALRLEPDRGQVLAEVLTTGPPPPTVPMGPMVRGIGQIRPPRPPARSMPPRNTWRTGRGTGYEDASHVPPQVWTGGRPGGSTIGAVTTPAPAPSIPIRPQPPGPLPPGMRPESVPPFLRPAQAGQRPAPAVGSAAVSKPRGASAAGGSARPCPSPEGCKGNPDHQATVERLRRRAEREFPDRRFEIRENKGIEKESHGLRRRPDVAVIDRIQKRVVKVYEAARANKDGVTPVSRERKKVEEYDAKGIPSHVEIVR